MEISTPLADLRRIADIRPGDVVLVTKERTITYGEMAASAECIASGLLKAGVQAGHRIAIVAEDSHEVIQAWFGIHAARCVDVIINPEARGSFLRYLLDDAKPSGIICSARFLDELMECITVLAEPPSFVAIIGAADSLAIGTHRKLQLIPFDALLSSAPDRQLGPRSEDVASIVFTSGTTGPSKGVALSHGYWSWFGQVFGEYLDMQPGERVLSAQPIFHVDPRLFLMSAITTGGSAALGWRFSASRFWQDMRSSGSTRFSYIGTMLWLLYKQEQTSSDQDQPARVAVGGAAPPEIQEDFERRFNVRILEMYGLTEVAMVTRHRVSESKVGSIGKPLPSLDVRLVDDRDIEVGPGHTGEIVCRPSLPNIISSGYWGKPDATLETWRNLWFHTGDFGRVDSEGFWYFVGRKKDAIRRRGENVSAWEVEQVFTRHPAVAEAAAIGVPSTVGEEDIAVLIVLNPDENPAPQALCEFAAKDLPYFMVPRYVEYVTALPKTPSERVAKDLVRQRGISSSAWDAEAAGWRPTRKVR